MRWITIVNYRNYTDTKEDVSTTHMGTQALKSFTPQLGLFPTMWHSLRKSRRLLPPAGHAVEQVVPSLSVLMFLSLTSFIGSLLPVDTSTAQ